MQQADCPFRNIARLTAELCPADLASVSVICTLGHYKRVSFLVGFCQKRRAPTLRSHAAVARRESQGGPGLMGCGRQVADQRLEVIEDQPEPVRYAFWFVFRRVARLSIQVLHRPLRARLLDIRPPGGQWGDGG